MNINSNSKSEVEKFNLLAKSWWELDGPMRFLHRMSYARMDFLRERVEASIVNNNNKLKILQGWKALDLGCGGGIASESLARMGAQVDGVDPAKELIDIAKNHAKLSDLDITYEVASLEKMVKRKKKYNLITVFEVLEHVEDVQHFIKSLNRCVLPGGIVIFSTINRTLASLIFAKIAAEYVFKIVPKNTHQWNKFLKPSEVAEFLNCSGFKVDCIEGLIPKLGPGYITWRRTRNNKVNYIISAVYHS